jgi:hypothetical protein
MKSEQDYTVDKVAWHTKVKGNPETPERVRRRFKVIVDFLQRNNLTVKQLLSPGEEPDDSFSIRASDLTSVGFEVMKRGYMTWLRRIVNKNKDVSNLSILEKALSEVRQEQ